MSNTPIIDAVTKRFSDPLSDYGDLATIARRLEISHANLAACLQIAVDAIAKGKIGDDAAITICLSSNAALAAAKDIK